MAPQNPEDVEDVDATGDDDMALSVIGAAASAAQKAGLIKALLHPSAKALGDYMGKRTQEWVDGLDARRARIVSTHYEKVKIIDHITPPKNGPTERQFNALVAWTEQAQSVDPEEEPELAALWQSLLSEIYNNNPYADEILVVLKNMTRGDARTFLRLSEEGRHHIPPPYLERFKQWGLVETGMSSRQLSYTAACLVLALMIALIGQSLPANQILSPEFVAVIPTMGILAGGMIAVMVSYMVIRDFSRARLTPLGYRLIRSGTKYFSAQTPKVVATATEPAPEPASEQAPKPSAKPKKAPARRSRRPTPESEAQ